MKRGSFARLGDRHDHRVVVADDAVLNVRVDLAIMCDPHALMSCRLVFAAVDEDRKPGTDLIARVEQSGTGNALAVDESAVGTSKIVDEPLAVVRRQLSVSA